MEALEDSITDFSKNISNLIAHSSQIKKICKNANIKSSEAERADIMNTAAQEFSKIFERRVATLLADCEIKNKLDELKNLTQASMELNTELGVTEGYRPINPTIDINGHLHAVQSSYSEILDNKLCELEESLEDGKEELAEKMTVLMMLEDQIKQRLNK